MVEQNDRKSGDNDDRIDQTHRRYSRDRPKAGRR